MVGRRSTEEQRKANAEALQKLKQVFADAKAYYDAKRAGRDIPEDQRWEAMMACLTTASVYIARTR